MKKLLLFVSFLAVVLFISCSDDEKYTVTVRLEKSGIANGTSAYAKLCEGGGQNADCNAKYRTSATFSGEVATISIDDVEEGTYTAGIFIDVDSDSAGSYIPDCDNDYAMGDQNAVIDDDINDIIEDGDWVQGSSNIPGCQ